jgi:bifunctional ADP-heptose synthase (sugar kinase/adenylyltransferase)
MLFLKNKCKDLIGEIRPDLLVKKQKHYLTGKEKLTRRGGNVRLLAYSYTF